MIIGEWIRGAAFWVLDYLQGSRIRKHYIDIKKIMENGPNPADNQILAGYLQDLLKYATENVSFYKKFKALDSIKSFPVINKTIIKDQYEAFLSREISSGNVVIAHTTGSTGTPFSVRQDKNKRDRVLAEMIYFWGKAGYQLGMRYAYFRIWNKQNRKTGWTTWARNLLMVDTQSLDAESIGKIRNMLRADQKIRMLIGYPSTFEILANHILTCGDKAKDYQIKTIIGIGEAFPETIQRKLSELFHCSVISLYSNQESGVLALECLEHKEFHVNNASYLVELLEMDSDEPVRVGEPGRIVVTDMFNYAMPMIRYDTGDVGVWKEAAECGWNSPVLSSVQGRLVNFVYDTQGKRISPHAIRSSMWPFEQIAQFQFIQEGAKKYVVKLNGAEGHYEEVAFVELFKDILGQDAIISIEHVHEIPVLASGKRSFVVNHFVKK